MSLDQDQNSTEFPGWLQRVGFKVGLSPKQLKNTWIAMRSGDANAALLWNQLMRDHSCMRDAMKYFMTETKNRRRDLGKYPLQKQFSNPKPRQVNPLVRSKDSRVKGVNTVYQGGLPSLGKSSK